MHNHAIFAIPGLMPPKAATWRSQLIAPEDGSLRLLVHIGKEDDTVNYTLDIPGWRSGIIKDPGYKFENRDIEDLGVAAPTDSAKENWPQFLKTSTELPENVLIPKVIIRGCPIELTELWDEEEGELTYFYLDCPARTLPAGDTEVQVVVNGKLRKHIVHRPDFNIHHRRGITSRYSRFKSNP